MRIAWICPYLPAPTNTGGRIRIAQIARSLAHHDLSLYARLAPDDVNPDELPADALRTWRRVRSAPAKRVSLTVKTPQLAKSFDPALRRLIARDDEREPFDLVIVEHCYAMHDLPKFQRAPVVLNEHNVESDYWFRELLRTGNPRRLVEYARWRAYERSCWNIADAITAVSKADARRIEAFTGRHCLVMPNGIDPEKYEFRAPSQRAGNGVLFVGVMSYEPNIAAAQWVAKKVMPRLRKRIPNATFTVAGRDPSPRVRALANDYVKVTGTVKDLAPLFAEHAVYVSAVNSGGGSSLKVLEPLLAGLPLVGLPFAVRGYDLAPGIHYHGAMDVDDAVNAVARILEDRASADEISERGRAYALKYAWSEVAKPFVTFVDELVARGRRSVTYATGTVAAT